MARQLFGTDGIRGVAGQPPLDAATVHAFGLALGEWARGHAESGEVLIGMDTRESGPDLASAVAAALQQAGAKPRLLGVITTPGVAYLTRTLPVTAGVMVSASHNPFRDNGLKVFAHTGYKVPDAEELALEERIFALRDSAVPSRLDLELEDLAEQYLSWLIERAPARLEGLRLVLDCGNGAASFLAPRLFELLGAEVTAIHSDPDGRNINEGCGALHLEPVRQAIQDLDADAGVAFDGDADRCMIVSKSGKTIDGDHTLLIAAKSMLASGRLQPRDAVVATVMSNLGFEAALKSHGLRLIRAAVGDKYVLEEMIRTGSPVGGEQSGHVIFHDHATTGDGMLTAMMTLGAAHSSGQTLDAMTAEFSIYPQLLVNIHVKAKPPLAELAELQQVIRDAEAHFGDSGRINVRYSGTELLARVMVEGPTREEVEHWAEQIAGPIRKAIGS
jgi:phosphoglucosamine mutase